MRPPTVSVIIATYNRSYVLRHAVGSVLASDLADWELLVVGDHCTDDSEQVVAEFSDPRVSFHNLPSNCGEQSGPNNAGLARARGRYVAFLNHDDLYFRDHLGSAIARLESSGADLVWVPYATAVPVPREALESGDWRFQIQGVPRGRQYDPMVFTYASSWVLRRELVERVGPWRPARETVVTPSQDWLFRAWRSGARIEFHDHLSLLAIPGGDRPNSYIERTSPEHDVYAAAMQKDPRFRELVLQSAAVDAARSLVTERFHVPLKRVAAKALSPVFGLCARLGIHPYGMLSRTGRKAALVNRVRRRQGLGDLPRQRG